MQNIKKVYQALRKVVTLLAFLTGITIGAATFLMNYDLLGLVIVAGLARALTHYFDLPQRIRPHIPQSSTTYLSKLRYASPLLDVASLVSSLALLIIGSLMTLYAAASPVPTSAIIGVLMVVAGIYCGAALPIFHERKTPLRAQQA